MEDMNRDQVHEPKLSIVPNQAAVNQVSPNPVVATWKFNTVSIHPSEGWNSVQDFRHSSMCLSSSMKLPVSPVLRAEEGYMTSFNIP